MERCPLFILVRICLFLLPVLLVAASAEDGEHYFFSQVIKYPQFFEKKQKLFAFSDALSLNSNLIREIKKSRYRGGKYLLKRGSCYLKKRHEGNAMNDLYVWELASVLQENPNIPAVIVYRFKDMDMLIQEAVEMEIGLAYKGSPKSARQVGLEEYWMGNLISYVLGLCDLHAGNIGITKDLRMVFFDNEFLDEYTNVPRFKHFAINEHSIFISGSFDWPQYRLVVDEILANKLTALASSWTDAIESIRVYSKMRNLPQKYVDAIVRKIELISDFPFRNGVRFADFYAYLYPELSEGLDDLCAIVGKCMGRKIGPGTALSKILQLNGSRSTGVEQVRKELDNWSKVYVTP